MNNIKAIVICDLHYDRRFYRGFDESRAWSWLNSIVDHHRPDLILSCGDWGSAINHREFFSLLRRTIVLSIYGNHENMDVLSSLYNVRGDRYLPVLMEDGRVYEFGNLRIAGISGIVSKKRKTKKGRVAVFVL